MCLLIQFLNGFRLLQFQKNLRSLKTREAVAAIASNDSAALVHFPRSPVHPEKIGLPRAATRQWSAKLPGIFRRAYRSMLCGLLIPPLRATRALNPHQTIPD